MLKHRLNKATVYRVLPSLNRMISGLSLFNKFFYGILFIVMLVLTISSISSYIYARNIFLKAAWDNTSRLVDNMNTGFADNLEQVDRIILSIYADAYNNNARISMREILAGKSYSSLLEELTMMQETESFFQRLMYLREDFNSIYIYVSEEKQFSYAAYGINKLDYTPLGTDWFQKTLAANGTTVVFAPHQPFQLEYGKAVVSYSRVLKGLGTAINVINGVILIDLSLDSIESIINKARFSPTTGVLLLDDANKVIYANQQPYNKQAIDKMIADKVINNVNGSFTTHIENEKYLIVHNTLKVNGWKSLTLTPYIEVDEAGNKLLLFNLFLAVVALAIAILISYVFSSRMFEPIQKLKRGIVQVKQGNFNFQLDVPANDELGQLVFSFNSMITQIKTLIFEKYEERIARREAEFKYLQSQINPHFMYNTLQIISGMASANQVPEISTVSKSLAKMLRYSINLQRSTVAIHEEIDNVICYLEIQKLRFQEFLKYDIYLEDEIYHYYIIKLILQPIVENAIIHGIEAKGEDGRIQLTGKCSEGELFIEIIDNGVGLTANEIDELMWSINEPEEEAGIPRHTEQNNVGLRNINRRIKLIYGNQYGLMIDSAKNEWTRVLIHIPAYKISEGRSNDQNSASG